MSWMLIILYLVVISSIYFVSVQTQSIKPKIRIAIIGSGLSGSSLAYFLTHCHDTEHKVDSLIRDAIQIDLFEKEDHVGGRTRSITFEGSRIDLGASHFTEYQHLMNYYIKEFNLQIVESKNKIHSDSLHNHKSIGIWNGTDFVLEYNEHSRMKLWAKMIARYGFSSPARTIYSVHTMLTRIKRIYKRLDSDDNSFLTIGEMIRHAKLEVMFNKTLYEYLTNFSPDHPHEYRYGPVSIKFISEVIDPLVRSNCGGQNSAQVHAFIGLYVLAPYLLGKKSQRIIQGTDLLVKSFIEYTRNAFSLNDSFSIRTGENVNAVVGEWNLFGTNKRKKESSKFRVISNKFKNEELYDMVVFAVPLNSLPEFRYERIRNDDEYSPVDFDEYKHMFPYKKMQVTLIRGGSLREEYFGCKLFKFDKSYSNLPEYIYTTNNTENSKVSFITIHTIQYKKGSTDCLYKIYSEHVLDDSLLDIIIEGPVVKILRKEWEVCPYFCSINAEIEQKLSSHHKHQRFPMIEPAMDVFLTSSMETVSSSMETQLISSLNIAKVMKKRITELLSERQNEQDNVEKGLNRAILSMLSGNIHNLLNDLESVLDS